MATLIISIEGEYTFYATADDRGFIKLGGKPLLHTIGGGEFASAKRFLKKGKHKFEFFYYQNTHASHILVQIEADGIIKRQKLPSAWYSIDGAKK